MLNKIEIIGHLGRDPETRYLPSGEAVVNFSVATTEKWKDKNTGELKEATQWHRVTAFGRLAEVMGEYLRKGSKCYISGKMKYGQYEKDGVTHYTADIQANELVMLDGKPSEGEGRQGGQERGAPAPRAAAPAPAPRQAAPRPASGFDDMDDDIPF